MKKIVPIITYLLFFSFIFVGCSINPAYDGQYVQNISKAEVVFNVSLPSNSNNDTGLFLEVVDEITGLGLNPTRYQMQSSDGLSYSLRMSFPIGFLLKYRYVREGNLPLIEYDTKNNQIRYRLAVVNSPLILNDTISGWQNVSYSGKTGVLQGYIFNSNTSEPISNVMVVINGMRTFTDANGFYTIADVPVGEYFLSAIHVDGLFVPFQQKAIIAANAITPANFGMKPTKMVNITFVVKPPAENLAGAPIRLFGDLLSLGNTFYDKGGGITTDVAFGKMLQYRDDGNYSLTLSLPAGNSLEYKYSLGDGFWNAERDSNKGFRIRRIIVPSGDTTIHDVIITWKNTEDSPLTFHISTPADTPLGALAFIQLNPFVWMEPLPLWNLGDNQWLYVLYSPMEFIKSSNYKILLNDSGKVKFDIISSNPASTGIKIDPLVSDIVYSVSQWSNK